MAPVQHFSDDAIISGRSTAGQTAPVIYELPWRKYRIGIHSEPIRTIPIHSDICIWANANHSEPIRKTFFYLVSWKTVKKSSFQSELEFSIRINPSHSDLGFIRIDSDWKFGLDQFKLRLIRIEKLGFGLFQNDSHWLGYRYRNVSK